MTEYERGVRNGKVEREAMEHFDVAHNGWESQENLHDWVKERYDEDTAEAIFPVKPQSEPYPGTVEALEKRFVELEARVRKLEAT